MFGYLTTRFDDSSTKPSEIEKLYRTDVVQFFRLMVNQEKTNNRIQSTIEKNRNKPK